MTDGFTVADLIFSVPTFVLHRQLEQLRARNTPRAALNAILLRQSEYRAIIFNWY